MVWIPVNKLSATSTGNDGRYYDQKFGRKYYWIDDFFHLWQYFPNHKYYDPVCSGLEETRESINKYGGEYCTRYKISKGKNGEPRSVKGKYPWTDISFTEAKKVAASMAKKAGGSLISHLPFGAEYDTRTKWAVETRSVTKEQVAKDSTSLGNYCNNDKYPNEMVKTGEDGCVNNIYGFAGNVTEWTQEEETNSELGVNCPIYRGGHYKNTGAGNKNLYRYSHVVEGRTPTYPDSHDETRGFRASYYLK